MIQQKEAAPVLRQQITDFRAVAAEPRPPPPDIGSHERRGPGPRIGLTPVRPAAAARRPRGAAWAGAAPASARTLLAFGWRLRRMLRLQCYSCTVLSRAAVCQCARGKLCSSSMVSATRKTSLGLGRPAHSSRSILPYWAVVFPSDHTAAISVLLTYWNPLLDGGRCCVEAINLSSLPPWSANNSPCISR